MQSALPLEDGHLSADQVSQYWDDGFLFPITVMDEAQAQQYRQQLETIEDEWLDNGLPRPLNSYKRVNAHLVMPFAFEIGSHPALLDVVEGILGPDLMIYSVEFFIKEAHSPHMVTMHQDLTYWGLGETSGMVTAWLALSPATPQSGCMDFVKGSHKQPIQPHRDSFHKNNLLSRGQEIAVDVADTDKTPIEIHPGQISLHHGLTIHGSGPNTSDDRRIAVVIRYIRPDVKQIVGTKDYAVLVRGEDRFQNFEAVSRPNRLFDPEDIARYEQIVSDQSKAKMAGAAKQTEIYLQSQKA